MFDTSILSSILLRSLTKYLGARKPAFRCEGCLCGWYRGSCCGGHDLNDLRSLLTALVFCFIWKTRLYMTACN